MMQNIENAIEIRNLYKNFKVVYDKPQTLKERLISIGNRNKIERREILKDITLDIKKGETVALIGTNGSGKSTLLKLMTKILYPNKGTLETNGKLTSLLELGAGFHQDFTGRENIYFNASIFGLTRAEIDERIDDIIEFSELGDFIDNPVRTYSSGMYMRLAFSVAINVDAEILLIDEILGVGDQHFQEKCYKRLEELRDSDKTVVIVSHSLEVVKKLCNRAIWIYKGKIKMDGEPQDVIDSYLDQITTDYSIDTIDKNDNYEGYINVDSPVSFSRISRNSILDAFGWELSECFDSQIRIFIDGKEIHDIVRARRMDVINYYENQFGGLARNPQPGWGVKIDISDLREGAHEFCAIVFDNKGKELSRKEITFYVE